MSANKAVGPSAHRNARVSRLSPQQKVGTGTGGFPGSANWDNCLVVLLVCVCELTCRLALLLGAAEAERTSLAVLWCRQAGRVMLQGLSGARQWDREGPVTASM